MACSLPLHQIINQVNKALIVTKKNNSSPSPSFEDAIKQLEQLVDAMEQGDMSLDDSLQAFEEGIKLTRTCQKSLDEAEQKVKILLENNAEAKLEPFENE
jgi:exodeoxyribonuclease VII small subunit